jgi:hypothetical protein
MGLQEELEEVVRSGERRSLEGVTEETDTTEALAMTLRAIGDGLLEGLKLLARRIEALESTQ